MRRATMILLRVNPSGAFEVVHVIKAGAQKKDTDELVRSRTARDARSLGSFNGGDRWARDAPPADKPEPRSEEAAAHARSYSRGTLSPHDDDVSPDLIRSFK